MREGKFGSTALRQRGTRKGKAPGWGNISDTAPAWARPGTPPISILYPNGQADEHAGEVAIASPRAAEAGQQVSSAGSGDQSPAPPCTRGLVRYETPSPR